MCVSLLYVSLVVSMVGISIEKLEQIANLTGLNKSMVLKVLIKTAEENETIKSFISAPKNYEG